MTWMPFEVRSRIFKFDSLFSRGNKRMTFSIRFDAKFKIWRFCKKSWEVVIDTETASLCHDSPFSGGDSLCFCCKIVSLEDSIDVLGILLRSEEEDEDKEEQREGSKHSMEEMKLLFKARVWSLLHPWKESTNIFEILLYDRKRESRWSQRKSRDPTLDIWLWLASNIPTRNMGLEGEESDVVGEEDWREDDDKEVGRKDDIRVLVLFSLLLFSMDDWEDEFVSLPPATDSTESIASVIIILSCLSREDAFDANSVISLNDTLMFMTWETKWLEDDEARWFLELMSSCSLTPDFSASESWISSSLWSPESLVFNSLELMVFSTEKMSKENSLRRFLWRNKFLSWGSREKAAECIRVIWFPAKEMLRTIPRSSNALFSTTWILLPERAMLTNCSSALKVPSSSLSNEFSDKRTFLSLGWDFPVSH